ncbi:MAG: hypothetical protein N3B16_06205, partial [Candidatus Aminicenantes bacterium]|nr:hypothetical protein [Candidatus Aminicenantes bacterium]
LFRQGEFGQADFKKEGHNGACYLKKTSRKKYFLLYESWAQKQRPLWQEEVKNLARRIADGTDALFE